MRPSTGFLLIGLIAGAVGATLYYKKRHDEESHDVEDLADRIQDRLKALETRLESSHGD